MAAPPNPTYCEGDTYVIPALDDDVNHPLADWAFDQLMSEVDWQEMHHRGGAVPRLVAVQTDIADGWTPLYRHPADGLPRERPWTPAVDRLRQEIEQATGCKLNHALIQQYRSGDDFISEHADKTLDIVPGSVIVNYSVGTERTMLFRSKRKGPPGVPRPSCRVPLPHGSTLVVGLRTNMAWTHSIPRNRGLRPSAHEQQAFNGARISLTFRSIGTFVSADRTLIRGQGAGPVGADPVAVDEADSVAMLNAFSAENHKFEYDWHDIYGRGFRAL
ncbi:uncharacterized protein V1510DRAFT_440328, partial [Dipodascopsis tothii]|uniref:uncharacterized protein n=1 Tax=Dipodascopsis tothii TaxID=44089 RepID=UPI0034CD5DCF